ncbi:MAG: FtsW/RodA/SpoVE family cell cycle protein, partial [Lewinella sp.]
MNISTRIATELRGDRVLWAIIIILSMISMVAVYSAVANLAYRNAGGAVNGYIFKHGVILGFGLIIIYIGHLLAYTKYSRWAPTMLVISIILLLLTQVFGTEINGARRWLTVPGINLTFQSSDFAKLSLILFVARAIGSKQDVIKDFREAFVPIILPVLGICLLIALSDLSSAIMLFVICILMMIVGR